MRILQPYGSKSPEYMFIDYSPRTETIKNGSLFHDTAGYMLFEYLETAGISTDICYFTALFKHRLEESPSAEEIKISLEYLNREIFHLKPKVLFVLGANTFSLLTGKKLTKLYRAGIKYHVENFECLLQPVISPWAVLKGGMKYVPEILASLVDTHIKFNPAPKKAMDYRYLDTMSRVKEYLTLLLTWYRAGQLDEYITVDLETSSLTPYNTDSHVLLVLITHTIGQAYAIPVEHRESPFNNTIDLIELKKLLKDFFESMIPVTGQNFKFDGQWIMKYFGVTEFNCVGDSMLAAYVLKNKTIRHGLDSLIPLILGVSSHKSKISDYLRTLPKHLQKSYANVPMQLLCEYAYEDSDRTFQILKILEKQLKEANLFKFYSTIMMDASYFFTHVEYSGAYVNMEILPKVQEFYLDFLKQSEDKIFGIEAVKKACQIHTKSKKLSAWQFLEVVLYHKDALALPKYLTKQNPRDKRRRVIFDEEEDDTKGGTGKVTLNRFVEDINDALTRDRNSAICYLTAHRFNKTLQYSRAHLEDALTVVQELIIWKKNSKLYSSYVKKIPELVRADSCVHPDFKLTSVATGRTSCTNPPMQTFPYHSKAKDPYESRYHGGFIGSVDYSQQELRVAAMMSGDKAMIQAFVEDKDIHRMITSDVMKIPFHEVPDHLRRHFKTIVFGILYGRGARAIAGALGIPVEEAQGYINKFYETRQELRQWIINEQARMKRDNYVITPFGRRILIYEPGDYDESSVNRYVINYPIQGTASDFGLIAGAQVQKAINQMGLKTKIFNFVHDSLMLDYYPTEVEIIYHICRYYMEEYPKTIFPFASIVPLRADFEIGIKWGDQVEYKYFPSGLYIEGNDHCIQEVLPRFVAVGYRLRDIQNLGMKEGDYRLSYLFDRPILTAK